ncbi:hypothetical protein M6B38_354450 [Iris pallida]|uniref:Uncharacterized protein n=1 Tax=Iris pallida TaxID=29817 RepID=A0AAX6GQF1_IRIPA|nr:hypothetical protein M6B38_152775 [Iris pallida]KAJ6830448.1 hypothetical protein M6B38_354450 [Iris pallida]
MPPPTQTPNHFLPSTETFLAASVVDPQARRCRPNLHLASSNHVCVSSSRLRLEIRHRWMPRRQPLMLLLS